MSKHKWIKVTEFSELYGNSLECIYAMKCTGSIPAHAFKRISPKVMLIDENYFIRREDFKIKTTNTMQEYYYYLVRYYSELQISKMLNNIDKSQSVASWSTFLSGGLFALTRDSITTTKISPKKWDFYRFTT